MFLLDNNKAQTEQIQSLWTPLQTEFALLTLRILDVYIFDSHGKLILGDLVCNNEHCNFHELKYRKTHSHSKIY